MSRATEAVNFLAMCVGCEIDAPAAGKTSPERSPYIRHAGQSRT